MGYFSASDLTAPTNWDFVTKNTTTKTSKASSVDGSVTSSSGTAPNIPQLPKDVSAFFANVDSTGYPSKVATAKARPWLKVWDGIVQPDSNGELLVACPKKADFGSNLGGY